MLKFSAFSILILFSTTSLAKESVETNPYMIEPIQYEQYYNSNGFDVRVAYNPNIWGYNFDCSLRKEFPINGKTIFFFNADSGNEDSIFLTIFNSNWTKKPHKDYNLRIQFGFLSEYRIRNIPFMEEKGDVIRTKHPAQNFLRNLSITEQLRFSYNDKVLSDFNLSGIAPAVNEFKRCLAENTKTHEEYEKRRNLKILDSLGQEFKPAHPNPFEE